MPPFKSLRGFMYPSVLCEFRKLYAYLISLLTSRIWNSMVVFLSWPILNPWQAKEDGDKPGLEAMLQKVLQIYASKMLSKRSYAKKGEEMSLIAALLFNFLTFARVIYMIRLFCSFCTLHRAGMWMKFVYMIRVDVWLGNTNQNRLGINGRCPSLWILFFLFKLTQNCY